MKSSFVVLILSFVSVLLSACAGHGSGADDGCVIEAFSTPSTGDDLGVVDSALGGDAIAQSFTVSAQQTVASVSLPLYKQGTIADGHYVTVTIETNSASEAPGSKVAAQAEASLYISTFTASAVYYDFVFSAPVTLAAGTYWIKLKGSYAISSSNLVKWAAHDGTGGYADGQAKYLNGSSAWATTAIGSLRDLLFRVGC